MSMALYGGSFDPIHLGHLDVIEEAARAFGDVVVAVLANPDKPGGMFTPAERVRLVTEATSHLSTVRSRHFEGLTVELARSVGATVLIRAAHKERDKEFSIAATNLRLAGIPTVLVPASPRTRAISSSLVRQLAAAAELRAAESLVPACVGRALADADLRTVR